MSNVGPLDSHQADSPPKETMAMTEVVYPRDGHPVTLGPCPPWCIERQHFLTDEIVDSDDGYLHMGAEIAVPTSYKTLNGPDDPETVVKVFLKSWTCPLDADPGPTVIELQLGTAEYNTDSCVDVTPAQARAIAQALIEFAATAEPGRP